VRTGAVDWTSRVTVQSGGEVTRTQGRFNTNQLRLFRFAYAQAAGTVPAPGAVPVAMQAARLCSGSRTENLENSYSMGNQYTIRRERADSSPYNIYQSLPFVSVIYVPSEYREQDLFGW
jgi:hypothetical protein